MSIFGYCHITFLLVKTFDNEIIIDILFMCFILFTFLHMVHNCELLLLYFWAKSLHSREQNILE